MKNQSLSDNLKKSAEFEIAEALIEQGPKRFENIVRIVNNKLYANRGKNPTIRSRG